MHAWRNQNGHKRDRTNKKSVTSKQEPTNFNQWKRKNKNEKEKEKKPISVVIT